MEGKSKLLGTGEGGLWEVEAFTEAEATRLAALGREDQVCPEKDRGQNSCEMVKRRLQKKAARSHLV
jgi:hypothetical protein